jgi:membrane protein
LASLKQDLLDIYNLGGLSFKELGRQLIVEVQEDNCLGYAAQLAYYFLFALFPFFLFLTALLGYLPITGLMDQIMELMARVMPAEALKLVESNLYELTADQRGGLLSFGIAVALWTSSSAIAAVSDALNRAYGVRESRPYWKVRGAAILLTIAFSAFIILSLVLLMFGPQIGRWMADQVGLGPAFEITWNIARWPVIIFFLIFGMAVLYYFTPDVEHGWKWITPGSVFAVILWILASLGFSYYVNNFGDYNVTYGSIGAIIVLLTWMYVSGLVILIGGEINSVIEHASPKGKGEGEKELS